MADPEALAPEPGPPEPHPEAPVDDGEVVARLRWVMFFRVLMISVLLASTLVVNVRRTDMLEDSQTKGLLGLSIGVYLLTIAYAWWLPRAQRLRLLTYVQLVGDLVMGTILVVITGGTESGFIFMFSITVMSAAIVLHKGDALFMTALSAAILCAMFAQEASGWGTPAEPLVGLAWRNKLLTLLTNVSSVFLVGVLSGYLSERLRYASEDVEQLRTLNEHIITSIQSGLVSFTLDWRIIFVNGAAEQMVGASEDAMLLTDVRRWFPSVELRVGDGTPRASRWEEIRREEAAEEPGGRQDQVLGMGLNPLVDSQGEHQGWILMIRDMTHLRTMEAAVRRSEKFAAIGMMAAGIAHEIRNPLASISGSIQMLRGAHSEAETDAERRLMEIVLREVDRLNTLISDFLDFARPPSVQLARVELGALLEEVIGMIGARGAQPEIELDLPGPIELDADPDQLRQVFWNLLLNAAEASEDQPLRVTARCLEGGLVEMRVIDHGVGIPPDQLARIFDPFFSTKDRGTGLGLSVVHRIVESHGGALNVESTVGAGSTFSITLPQGGRR